MIAAGTRPELIKLSTMIKHAGDHPGLNSKFLFTGQHYDYRMSSGIMRELRLPDPDFEIQARPKSGSTDLYRVLVTSAQVLEQVHPTLVVVLGDTDSALGVSLAATKLSIRIAHVEAGCRSFDKSTPEEVNRMVVSDLATIHFAATPNCRRNLLNEGISPDTIKMDGHPIVDVVDGMKRDIAMSNVLSMYRLKPKEYYLATIHRQENTEDLPKLRRIFRILRVCSMRHPVVLPLHPRTQNRIAKFGLEEILSGLLVLPPLGYSEFLTLVKHATAVLTDSAGVQQEASILRTYCVTLRSSTEWTETVTAGSNFVVGSSLRNVEQSLDYVEAMTPVRPATNVFRFHDSTFKILEHISRYARK